MSSSKNYISDNSSSSSSSDNESNPTQSGGGGSSQTPPQGSQVSDGTQATKGNLGRTWRLTNAEMRILGKKTNTKIARCTTGAKGYYFLTVFL